MKQKRKKGLKIILWTVCILITLVIILQLVISEIATKATNNFLADKVKIGKISINLFGGSVKVTNVVVKQPEGFNNTDLLQIGKVSAKVRYLPILQKKIVVNDLNISNVKADIQKINDESDIQNLFTGLGGLWSTVSKKIKSIPSLEIYVEKVSLQNSILHCTEINDSLGTKQITLKGIDADIRKIHSFGTRNLIDKVTLVVDKTIVNILDAEDNKTQLEVNNFTSKINNIDANSTFLQIPTLLVSHESLYFSIVKDDEITEASMPEFVFTINDIQTAGNNISIKEAVTDSFEVFIQLPDSVKLQLYQLNLSARDLKTSQDTLTKPAEVIFTGKTLNNELGDSLFGFYAQISEFANNFPTIDAALQIVGLELEPIMPMIPPGTCQALGGDAFDLSAELAICDTQLKCDIDISMIQGSKLGMEIGGTPAKPELDTSSVLFNVFSRFGGGIGSIFAKLGGTTFGAAKTSLTTVLGIGKGASNVAGSLGNGVFKSVKGVVTLDASEIGDGLKTTTLGTVKESGETVLNMGGNLIEGTGNALGEVSGKTTASEWRNAKAARWIELWDKAKKKVKDRQ